MRRLLVVLVVGLVVLASCGPPCACSSGRMVRPRTVRARRPRVPRAARAVRSGAKLAGTLARAIEEAATLAKVANPTAAQRRRAAQLNALFEDDMRARDGLSGFGADVP